VFLVDDNFIGNKKNVKALLVRAARLAAGTRQPVPFRHRGLARPRRRRRDARPDDRRNFVSVFLGIETPDVESLELTRKHQNNRGSMSDAVRKIQRRGMRVMAGFIIGFDGEKAGAGERIWQFIEQTNVTHGMLSMLQVLPNTGLFTRLTKKAG
jgi:radical SAM superfamily enzyme YgiQ (UPF0313 family)